MTSEKPLKKNASIEVRLPDAVKSAFMDRCRDQELTASEVIRLFIDNQIAVQSVPPRQPLRYIRVAIAGLVGTIFGLGLAAPSVARSSADIRIEFQKLDRNHDGVIDRGEFNAG
jgi:hypothetical protein